MGSDTLPMAHIPGRMQPEINGLEVMQLKRGEHIVTDAMENLLREDYVTVMDVQLKKDCRVTDWSGAFEQWRKNNQLNNQLQMKEKYIVNTDFSEEKLAVQHFDRQGMTVRIRLCTQFKFHSFLALTGEQSSSKREYDEMMEKWICRVQVHMTFKADLKPAVMAPLVIPESGMPQFSEELRSLAILAASEDTVALDWGTHKYKGKMIRVLVVRTNEQKRGTALRVLTEVPMRVGLNVITMIPIENTDYRYDEKIEEHIERRANEGVVAIKGVRMLADLERMTDESITPKLNSTGQNVFHGIVTEIGKIHVRFHKKDLVPAHEACLELVEKLRQVSDNKSAVQMEYSFQVDTQEIEIQIARQKQERERLKEEQRSNCQQQERERERQCEERAEKGDHHEEQAVGSKRVRDDEGAEKDVQERILELLGEMMQIIRDIKAQGEGETQSTARVSMSQATMSSMTDSSKSWSPEKKVEIGKMMETAIRRTGVGKLDEAAITEECIGIFKKAEQAYKMRQERMDQMAKTRLEMMLQEDLRSRTDYLRMVVETMIGPMIGDIVEERLMPVERAIEEIVQNPTPIYAPKVAVAVKKDLDPTLRALVAQVHKNTTVVETLFKSAVRASRGGDTVDDVEEPFIMNTAFDTMMRLQDALVELRYNTTLSTNAFSTMANKIARAVERNEDNTRRANQLGLNPRSAIEALSAALADPELNERLQEVVNFTVSQDGEIRGGVRHHGSQEGKEVVSLDTSEDDDDNGRDIQQALANSLEDANRDLKPAAKRGGSQERTTDRKSPPEELVRQAAMRDTPGAKSTGEKEETEVKLKESVPVNTGEEVKKEAKEMMASEANTSSLESNEAGNDIGHIGEVDVEMKGQENATEDGSGNKMDTPAEDDEEQKEGMMDTEAKTIEDSTEDGQEVGKHDGDTTEELQHKAVQNDDEENTDKKEDTKEMGNESRRGTTVFSLSSSTSSSQSEEAAEEGNEEMSETYEDAQSSPSANDGEEQ
eukprot:scaffold19660_cov43-Cyclotella_meneghiniana.AAC.1